MDALANSMTPKDDYCLQYGISLDEGEWDIACVPQSGVADRGELNGKQIEDERENLEISIHNAPPYRGDAKGIIESAFAQMGMKVKPFADGIVKNGKNIVGIGEQDYRLKANITIEEFTKIIIKCVLFHNNHRSEEHTSELQSRGHLVCRLLLEKKNKRERISARAANAA